MHMGPRIIRYRYGKTHLERQQDGKRVLAALPKREPGEREEIKRILSSYHCRTCAKCCRGGFSIGENEKEYGRIMELMKKNKKNFIVECMGKGMSGNRYYDIGVPMKMNACGFLNWEGGKITHRTLIFSDGKDREGKPFSCGIYDGRASVCLAYPMGTTWMRLNISNGIQDDEGTIIMDAVCPAIMELLENGIGHVAEKELLELAAEPGLEKGCLLSSFPRSMQEIKDRSEEAGKENHILLDERGERIYPIKSWEIFIENK